VGLEPGRGWATVKGGSDSIHELAAVDEHREVGAGARTGVELALTIPGHRGENDDAGAPLDHLQAFFRGTVGGRGDDNIIETGAIEDRLADRSERKPPRPFDLAD